MTRRPALSDAQIDRVFTRLVVRYGAAFSERWRMLDLAVVKADWARELGRYAESPYVFDWALERLPEKPPTVIDFAHLCDQAPRHEPMTPSTEPTRSPNEIELDMIAQLRAANLATRPEKQWAYNLIAKHRRGERVDWYPLCMAREVVDADRRGTAPVDDLDREGVTP